MRVCAAQIGSVLFDNQATLARIEECCRQAAAEEARLVVFPEALLGGYPKGLTFGVTMGNRSNAGRDLFLRYAKAAVAVDGPEVQQVIDCAQKFSLYIVIGIVEKAGGTLYCSSLLLSPEGRLLARHRKLMPTAMERVIWGCGAGDDLQVVDTAIGRIGMAICWENYMPLYRQHLFNQNVTLWCAPTVDARPMWRTSMQHIAYEGRCFVISACQHLEADDWPSDFRQNPDSFTGVIAGGSVAISPSGEILAGPHSGAGLLFADFDLDEIARGKFDLDVAGHYSRPDVFRLVVHPNDTP